MGEAGGRGTHSPSEGRLVAAWKRFDRFYLREWFGGNPRAAPPRQAAPIYSGSYASGFAVAGGYASGSQQLGSGLLSRRASSRVARLLAGESMQTACSWQWGATHQGMCGIFDHPVQPPLPLPPLARASDSGSSDEGGGGGGGGGVGVGVYPQ